MEVRVSRASSVIIHRVPPSGADRFREWLQGIAAASAKFPGYEATDVYAPVEGEQDWVIILHFTDSETMQGWLKSTVRAEWLTKLQGAEAEFQLKSLPSGFGAWFTGLAGPTQGPLPPAWKMVLSVLLGLYPTVMLLTLFVNPHLDRLGRAASILIGTVLSVCLLQWLIMPALQVLLARWLRVRPPHGRAITVWGLVLILLALGGIWFLFRVATDSVVHSNAPGAGGPLPSRSSGAMNVSQITTHVLDTTRGRPAAGVSVRLEAQGPDGWHEIGAGLTNDDGRIVNLGPARLEAGSYRMEVDIGAYYRKSQVESFFTTVSLSFALSEPAQHYHVPLLISPFAVSTYRGS